MFQKSWMDYYQGELLSFTSSEITSTILLFYIFLFLHCLTQSSEQLDMRLYQGFDSWKSCSWTLPCAKSIEFPLQNSTKTMTARYLVLENRLWFSDPSLVCLIQGCRDVSISLWAWFCHCMFSAGANYILWSEWLFFYCFRLMTFLP